MVVPSCEHKNTILENHKAMSQKKRTDKSSTTAAVQGFAGVMSDVPLPDGIELRSDLERTIWHQFSRAHAREDWRDMDLILLAKIERMEADIRTAQTLNGFAKLETKARSAIAKVGADDLIARPQ